MGWFIILMVLFGLLFSGLLPTTNLDKFLAGDSGFGAPAASSAPAVSPSPSAAASPAAFVMTNSLAYHFRP